ncbi:glycosyltransferase [Pedobacter sp. BMA]|uniref:glycosyltransferase n=1 Tax=Pedobacter sp. BMA TaxID=1663685 RepID=UPI00064B44BF|nr:glycosyltransferase [Pedobacter sp. BMA]KLT67004.1 glycosyl transferase family 1 [Pedobacter sp. BMA]
MKNRNIIIVGQQAWDTEIGSNCKNIAVEFSKHNRVLYINPPLDRITKIRRSNNAGVKMRLDVIAGKQEGLQQINNNLYTLYPDCLIESINWLPFDTLFNVFNRLNNQRFYRAIKPTIDALGFEDVILFNDSDIFRSFYLIDFLKPAFSVYYSRDNMIATTYYERHGTSLEPKLIAKSNICVANSEFLKDYCATYNPNAFYVGQGCDFELFDEYLNSKKDKIKGDFVGPVIGYVGVLTSARLDISLIGAIAKAKPEWNIVLVGPEDEDFLNSELHQLQNVHFTGPKPVTDLPVYIDSFDVCFNPQVVNDLTIGNYPRKIDEYLVLGKPTIATATKSMQAFKHYVSLAGSLKEYIDGIHQLLSNNNAELIARRKAFARSHSWERSVKEIYESIGV